MRVSLAIKLYSKKVWMDINISSFSHSLTHKLYSPIHYLSFLYSSEYLLTGTFYYLYHFSYSLNDTFLPLYFNLISFSVFYPFLKWLDLALISYLLFLTVFIAYLECIWEFERISCQYTNACKNDCTVWINFHLNIHKAIIINSISKYVLSIPNASN